MDNIASSRRGSPLLVGIKAEGLESDSIPVQYSQEDHPKTYAHIPADLDPTSSPLIPRKKTSAMFRVDSDHVSPSFLLYPTKITPIIDPQTEEIHPSDGDAVEYFFASDASAIIEHTNRVRNTCLKYPSNRWSTDSKR